MNPAAPQNSRWHWMKSPPGSAAWNMALDEALLETMPVRQHPILRFYSWQEQAASFGYFQKFKEIEQRTLLRPLIRRPTGGGLVPHDSDWTYSACFPAGSEWHELSAAQSYERVHFWIQQALETLKVKTVLAPEARSVRPGECFEGYEKSDVLWQNKKIAGAAQRRNRNGLLIQGSVQPPLVPVSRTQWEEQMLLCVPKGTAHSGWEEVSPAGHLEEKAAELLRKKYSQSQYNQRR